MNVFMIVNENGCDGSWQDTYGSDWDNELRSYLNRVFDTQFNIGKTYTVRLYKGNGCYDLLNPSHSFEFTVTNSGLRMIEDKKAS